MLELSIASTTIGENTLSLHLDFESYGEHFEVVRPISIAADRGFEQPFAFIGSDILENGQHVYTFAYNGNAHEIYVKPPVIYIPTEVETVSIPAALNATMQYAVSATSEDRTRDTWFSISSIDVDVLERGLYQVSVEITPHTADFPRFPILATKDTSYEGTISLGLDEYGVFDRGAFLFWIPANSADEVTAILNDASITVKEAFIRAVAYDAIRQTTSSKYDGEPTINIIVD